MTTKTFAQLKYIAKKTKSNGHLDRIGQMPVINGKPAMKCVGLMREDQGFKVHWQDKPGWQNGELIAPKLYDEWFEKVRY